jgi:Tfp pilus assembly protein PilX
MKALKQKLNQKGLVTIVSVIIIVIIITIITLSLAALTRRGLRQSLDEQLSTQAQYAAESGVNAAIKLINDKIITSNVDNCNQTGVSGGKFEKNILNENVKYSCVLVDLTSDTISTDLASESIKVYPLVDPNGLLINTLNIKWSNPSNLSTPLSCSTQPSCLTNQTGWGVRPGLLRVKLIPYPTTGLQRSAIDSGAIDITAYPFAITGYGNSADASITKNHVLAALATTCDGRGICSINVTGLSSPGRYYVQLYSYYASTTNVNITGTNSSGTAVKFTGAQATIDSTGISQDIVKRLRVKVALDASSNLPIYALSSGESLCKRFTTNAAATANADALTNTNCPAF